VSGLSLLGALVYNGRYLYVGASGSAMILNLFNPESSTPKHCGEGISGSTTGAYGILIAARVITHTDNLHVLDFDEGLDAAMLRLCLAVGRSSFYLDIEM